MAANLIGSRFWRYRYELRTKRIMFFNRIPSTTGLDNKKDTSEIKRRYAKSIKRYARAIKRYARAIKRYYYTIRKIARIKRCAKKIIRVAQDKFSLFFRFRPLFE
jgi:hypothetical protein